MNINATLAITYRPNEEPRSVVIEIRDVNSRIDIFRGKISYEEFTAALGTLYGRPFVEAEFAAEEAAHVGKYLEVKSGTIQAPAFSGYSAATCQKYKEWLRANGGEPGWQFNTYLESHDSITRNAEGALLKYRMFRYLETKPEPPPKEEGAKSKTKKKSGR